jgi:hypothetical protein
MLNVQNVCVFVAQYTTPMSSQMGTVINWRQQVIILMKLIRRNATNWCSQPEKLKSGEKAFMAIIENQGMKEALPISGEKDQCQ